MGNVISLHRDIFEKAVRPEDALYVVAGQKILTEKPTQQIRSPENILHMPKTEQDKVLREKAAQLRFVAEQMASTVLSRIATYERLIGTSATVGEIKSVGRMIEKALTEKDGQIEGINDVSRFAFYCPRNAQIERALHHLHPAHNAEVVEYLDEFPYPHPRKELSRAKVILQVPCDIKLPQGGLVTEFNFEVMIFSKKAEEHYKASHGTYERQRAFKAAAFNADRVSHGCLSRCNKEERSLSKERLEQNRAARISAGLEKFDQERTFFNHNGIPFMTVERPNDSKAQTVVLRPDYETGKYVHDQSFARLVSDPGTMQTSAEAFMRACINIGVEHAKRDSTTANIVASAESASVLQLSHSRT
ncbi:MAG: hypothetical protein RBR86_03210 [Pseudobdellovibrionaceae bacterium]|jgi:hypothetical protein|nr:hypothetical protein [Pseudobdellovibrionaceae bacterium]